MKTNEQTTQTTIVTIQRPLGSALVTIGTRMIRVYFNYRPMASRIARSQTTANHFSPLFHLWTKTNVAQEAEKLIL